MQDAVTGPAASTRAPGLAQRKIRRPRDSTEHLLAGIWEAALGVEPVGIDDDFYLLGGDSARADAALRALADSCGVHLERAVLERAATIRALADEIKERNRGALSQRCRSFHAAPGATPFFFVHGDLNGAGLYCARLAAALGPDVALHALTPHGPYGPAALDSVGAMADFHIETLRSIAPRGPYPLGGFCHGGVVALEMARRLAAQGEDVPIAILIGPQVWGRYWKLRRFIARTAPRLGLGAQTEARIYLSLRALVQPLFTRLDRWRAWRAGCDLDLLPRTRSPQLVVQDWLRARRRLAARAQAGNAALTGLEQREASRRAFWAAIVRVSRLHAPEAWDGKLALLWPEREALFRFGDPELSWRQVAPRLTVHAIPGGHNDALVRHVAEAARCISRCLADGAPNARAP